MALSTYTELLTGEGGITDTLGRTDLDTVAVSFVRLAEGAIDARVDLATHRRRICRSRAMISTEYSGLASNYLSVQSIEIVPDVPAATTNNELAVLDVSAYAAKRLLRADPDTIADLKNQAGDQVTGEPAYYAIVGTELRLYPVPDRAYALLFTVYERLPALASYGTNWVLNYYPDVYLWGSLRFAAIYLRDDERLAAFTGLYETACGLASVADPEESSRVPLRSNELSALGRRSGFDINRGV